MAGMVIDLFATRDDLLGLLDRITETHPLHWFAPDDQSARWPSAHEVPGFPAPLPGTRQRMLLCVPGAAPRDPARCIALQSLHPLGGGGMGLRLTQIGEGARIAACLSRIDRAIQRDFIPIGDRWVGPFALSAFRRGAHLRSGNGPAETGLSIPRG